MGVHGISSNSWAFMVTILVLIPVCLRNIEHSYLVLRIFRPEAFGGLTKIKMYSKLQVFL